ncbi:VOC family protein [Spirillospora sp. NPDC048824]|uniref:VOC family protein n=1 Tax=Spirillospora sp. NPDC048824 TaxID=3364526 RepID=UPI0037154C9B
MELTIHSSFLPLDDPDASLAFYRDVLGFEVRGDVGHGGNLATADLDGAFERLRAGGAEIVQEPTDQPYGVRDCAVRDPAGNLIRIQEQQR